MFESISETVADLDATAVGVYITTFGMLVAAVVATAYPASAAIVGTFLSGTLFGIAWTIIAVGALERWAEAGDETTA